MTAIRQVFSSLGDAWKARLHSWIERWFGDVEKKHEVNTTVEQDRPVDVFEPIKPVNQTPLMAHEGDDVQSGENGDFYFRETILDDLDIYFKCLRRMRSSDPDGYAFYSRVGSQMVPSSKKFIYLHELDPWWKFNRPAFGSVAWGCSKTLGEMEMSKENLNPRFIYFTKYQPSRAPAVYERARVGEDVYEITCFYDDHFLKGKLKAVLSFAVGVDRSGYVRPLKERITETIWITPKKQKNKKNEFCVRRSSWGISRSVQLLCNSANSDPVGLMRTLFVMAANIYASTSNGMIRVSVKDKNGLAAVFSVDVKRTPYFFKDRDAGEGGRIFHIVRPHMRRKASGLAPVKMHFRGLRDFNWNGYRVHITVPGRHHKSLNDLTEPVQYIDRDDKIPDGLMGMKKLGGLISSHVEAA